MSDIFTFNTIHFLAPRIKGCLWNFVSPVHHSLSTISSVSPSRLGQYYYSTRKERDAASSSTKTVFFFIYVRISTFKNVLVFIEIRRWMVLRRNTLRGRGCCHSFRSYTGTPASSSRKRRRRRSYLECARVYPVERNNGKKTNAKSNRRNRI